MKKISLLAIVALCNVASPAFAGGAIADGIEVKQLTLENIDQLAPELRAAICQREVTIAKKKIVAKQASVKDLERRRNAARGTSAAQELAAKVAQEAEEIAKLQQSLAELQARLKDLDDVMEDVTTLRSDVDELVETVGQLKLTVEEIKRSMAPAGIGVALGYVGWKSFSGLQYGAPVLELRYSWPTAHLTDVYLAVDAAVWPTDKNPFSFMAKTGVTVPLVDQKLGLRLGADMGAFSIDTQLKARCYLVLGELGLVWKPLTWLEIEAEALGGSDFRADHGPSFAIGGQGMVRVVF